MSSNIEVIEVTEEDREYFRQKYNRALQRNPASAEKYRKQLEMLEDSLIIYKLEHKNYE
jgi:uncharacterized protein YybS (DUF2232 family)